MTSVRELPDGVEVTDGSGATTTFDAVVIATHPSHALGMLESPSDLQREVLSALPYSSNPALLHTDASLLPDAVDARASWNFHRPADETGAVTVTYDLTRLQRLPTDTHYLVTLGGEDLVDPATVIDRMEYEHPLYTPDVGGRLAAPAGDQHRPDRLRRRLPRLGLPRGRCALGTGRGDPPRPRRGPARRTRSRGPGASRRRSGTPGVRRSPAPSSTPPPSGWSTSTSCPTTAPRPLRGPRPPRLARTARCATTSRRSSPTTASPSATATGRARS